MKTFEIEKLAKIGFEAKQGSIHMIRFNNLQRFVDRKLSEKGFSKQCNASFTYSVKNNEWFGDNSFNETEKQEMIQAILNYEPSDDEVKEVPYKFDAPAPRPKMSQEEALRCRKFDCETAEDRYYSGVSDLDF